MRKIPLILLGILAITSPAAAQVDLTGSWAPRLYEDYIERGPGSDLGDFTGVPMTDEARAKALLYTSNLPSTVERQCLPQSPWVVQYRPRWVSLSPMLRAYHSVVSGPSLTTTTSGRSQYPRSRVLRSSNSRTRHP